MAAITLTMAAPHVPAWAVDYIWKGSNGSWNDPNQWTLLGLPGNGDSVSMAAGNNWLDTTTTIGALHLTGGLIYGTGHLTVGTLAFRGGQLGYTNPFPVGSTTVSGSATFDGSRSQGVSANHTLNLLGTSTWTAGTGAIGSTGFGGAVVNAAGATFVDQGTGATGTYKALRDSSGFYNGGTFVNHGTYTRNGMGTTRAYGFTNNGVLDVNSGTFEMRAVGGSSGQINVAADAVLAFNDSTATLSGTVINQGLVSFIDGNVGLTANARIGGAVRVLGGTVYNESTNTLSSLAMQGGFLYGTGHLTVGTLAFTGGQLGYTNPFPVGSTTVSGSATFDGGRNQGVSANHTLNLLGTSTWTAGTGAIGSSGFGGAVVNATGATFVDQGTGATGTYKVLRDSSGFYNGGTFVNHGTYTRNGMGTTRAYGFTNGGVLDIQSGAFAVDANFNNAGTVSVAQGAVLAAISNSFSNAGLLTGDGTAKTLNKNEALTNTGTLAPGSELAVGSLTIDGDLAMTDSATLRIDFDTSGQADHLTITDDVAWNGTLAVWAPKGTVFHQGDSFTVATYGHRLGASTFDSFTWLGAGANPFTVDYSAHGLALRVTSAVPEPATCAQLLGGCLVLMRWRRRARAPLTKPNA